MTVVVHRSPLDHHYRVDRLRCDRDMWQDPSSSVQADPWEFFRHWAGALSSLRVVLHQAFGAAMTRQSTAPAKKRLLWTGSQVKGRYRSEKRDYWGRMAPSQAVSSGLLVGVVPPRPVTP
ncbi:hypothetical protein EOD39_7749 [Acipenser ruthenus]|uniref:Uncharacterized protein n=1 Tax=Acipenser ruthenus TaxID=7906 RepID=A0A444U5Y6_ACIRT|nr:hypothetical protein EOD39_7749 [Acipenser ruthenus]